MFSQGCDKTYAKGYPLFQHVRTAHPHLQVATLGTNWSKTCNNMILFQGKLRDL